jgi:3-deoxy-7-phosphoheptulonate synthase
MIIPNINVLSDEQLKEVTDIVTPFGCKIMVIKGQERSIYAIVGDERNDDMVTKLEGLPYVDRVDRIQSPHKLMDVRGSLATHRVKLGGVELGKEPFFCAGPCTIDPKNPNLTIESAHAVKEAGAHVLRGGVWKPRSNPYSYQGDAKALLVLMEASRQTGLPVDTEVMDEEHLKLALDAGVDCLQVGARNALNYSLLRQIGKAIAGRDTCVLLKRGLHMGPAQEFIAAAEYIVQLGNPNVILCPRGTQPTLDGYRNHPDESIVPLLKERTWAPVVVDPSHSVGKATYVPAAALAAIAYGADGLCIECNIQPNKGIGDDPKQAVTPEVLKQIISRARELWRICHSVST